MADNRPFVELFFEPSVIPVISRANVIPNDPGLKFLKPNIVECVKAKLGGEHERGGDIEAFYFTVPGKPLGQVRKISSSSGLNIQDFMLPPGVRADAGRMEDTIVNAVARTDSQLGNPKISTSGLPTGIDFSIEYGDSLLKIRFGARPTGSHLTILRPTWQDAGVVNNERLTKITTAVQEDLLKALSKEEIVIDLNFEEEEGEDFSNLARVYGKDRALVEKVRSVIEECGTLKADLEPKLGKKVAQREARKTLRGLSDKLPPDVTRKIAEYSAAPKITGGRKKTKKKKTRSRR